MKYVVETIRDPETFNTILRIGNRETKKELLRFVGDDENINELIEALQYFCKNKRVLTINL